VGKSQQLEGALRSRIVGEGEEAPDQLLANPLNWRTHPKHQADALEDLLKQVGWVQRVIVNQRTGHIVDGHLRVQVGMRRNEPSIPVIYVDLSEDEERLVLAVLDPIGGLAGVDQNLLDQVLAGITADGDALSALLEDLRSEDASADEETGATDDDDVPLPEETPVSRRGDVWLLGRHRLMVGDSTAPADVEKLMADDKADMVWMDPPYNVAYEDSEGKSIQNDDMADAQFRVFLRDAFGCAASATKEGGPIYIAHADSEGLNFRGAMVEAGWLLKQTIIWIKESFTLGRQDHQWQHEPILYGWKPGAGHCWYGDRDKSTVMDDDVDLKKLGKPELVAIINDMRNSGNTTVYRHAKPTKSDLHPTMKPVALVKHQVRNSSRRGEIVLDLFGGSGTTMIACEALGRRARLMELDPIYADVIVRRWQAWAKDEATREADGLTFDQAAQAPGEAAS
jgi:DNA modification methylase